MARCAPVLPMGRWMCAPSQQRVFEAGLEAQEPIQPVPFLDHVEFGRREPWRIVDTAQPGSRQTLLPSLGGADVVLIAVCACDQGERADAEVRGASKSGNADATQHVYCQRALRDVSALALFGATLLVC